MLGERATQKIIRRVVKTFLSIVGAVILIVTLILFLLSSAGEIAVGRKSVAFDLSYLVKLAALRERQVYFLTWYDKIIAPDVSDPQVKLNRIFRWIAEFSDVPQAVEAHNVEQHEYYTLIKQYGNVSEKVRVFCLILTIAGYQAIPFNGEADGRVIVRIPSVEKSGASKWFKYNFKTKRVGDQVRGINLSENVQNYLESVDTLAEKLLRPAYTRGEKNIPSHRVLCKLQLILPFVDVSLIDYVTNQQAVRTSSGC